MIDPITQYILIKEDASKFTDPFSKFGLEFRADGLYHNGQKVNDVNEYLKKFFERQEIQQHVGLYSGIGLALILIATAYKLRQMWKDKKYKACSAFKDDHGKQEICRKKYDIEILKKQIDVLRKGLTTCGYVKKKQDKCKKRIMDEIRKKEMKIKKHQDKLKKWGTS